MPLPPPSPGEAARSERLCARIRSEIENGGWLSFARYMELALYAPGEGYYSAARFGGDFVTAPEMSSLFARTLARQAAQILGETGGGILEFGAGSGRLALDLMRELESVRQLPERYSIIELSACLASRQRALIDTHASQFAARFKWLEELPARFTGLIVANEVLDAMPVHIVAWRSDGIYERGVALERDRFCWSEKKLESGALFEIASGLKLAPGYVSEIGLAARAFIATLAPIIERGALLAIDYGFGEGEYYHPQRSSGTLMCHYRNQAHGDPFYLPGLQDITSHVDFSAVAHAGIAGGLELFGYTTQANFLINCGITGLLSQESPENIAEYLPLSAGAQKLLSPSEMGELFKVIALGKNLEGLIGFARGDKSRLL